MKKIVLCGGGTGGHIVPNISLVPLLSQSFDSIHYIAGQGDKELITTICPQIVYHTCDSVKLVRPISTLSNLLIPLRLKQAHNKATKILNEISPDIVFSKGGYASLPVLFAAKTLGIPYILHESDASMGLANKLCAKHAKLCLASFESAIAKLKNGVLTGSPIRQSMYNGSKSNIDLSSLDPSLPTLLFIGGSSGAKAINSLVRESLPELIGFCNIIHITGKNNTDDFRQRGYLQLPFVYNIGDYLSASDMVVTRAGANALFELVALAIPTLAIPLPKSTSRGDQIQNADYFAQKKCIHTVAQDTLNKDALIKHIKNLYNDRHNLIKNCKAQPNIDGTQSIAKLIVDALQ